MREMTNFLFGGKKASELTSISLCLYVPLRLYTERLLHIGVESKEVDFP